MREVFTHQDVTQVGYYKTILDEAGISSFIRNEYTANPEIAGAMYFPTLCVVDQTDYEKAIALLKSQKFPETRNEADWICTSCLEANPSNFESCWKCNSLRPTVSQAGLPLENASPFGHIALQPHDHTHRSTNPETDKKVYFAIFLFLALVGAWCIASTLGDLTEAFQSKSWPTTTGKIESSDLKKYAAGRRSNATYLPEIKYTYTVAGQNFTGTVISPGRWWSNTSAFNAVERFPAGSARPIAYFPVDPSRAVLDSGLHPGNFGHFVMGTVFCTLAIPFIFLILGVNQRQKRKFKRTTFDNTSPAARYAPFIIALVFLELGIFIWISRN